MLYHLLEVREKASLLALTMCVSLVSEVPSAKKDTEQSEMCQQAYVIEKGGSFIFSLQQIMLYNEPFSETPASSSANSTNKD